MPSRDASLDWTFGRRAVARSAVLRMSALLDAGGGLQRAPHFSLNAQPPAGGDEHGTERRLEAEQFRFEADQQHGHKQTERAQDVGQQPSAQHLASEEEGQP